MKNSKNGHMTKKKLELSPIQHGIKTHQQHEL